MSRLSSGASRRYFRLGAGLVSFVVLIVAIGTPAGAHAGSLTYSSGPPAIPRWVFAVSGGGVVAFSFLLSALVTDRDVIYGLRNLEMTIPVDGTLPGYVGSGLGLFGLFVVVIVGFVGPSEPLSNAAILLVWVGWWAGYTMSTYLLGNTWPWINPWRTVAGMVPSLDREYPDSLGRWPAVIGLLFLVFLEVVTPTADRPAFLSTMVLVYTAITLVGAVTVGPADWFRSVDPIAGVFRAYGRLAPVQWRNGRPTLAPPTAKLDDMAANVGLDDVSFVIALLWVTTFDGLVSTPGGSQPVRWAVALGVSPLVAYGLVLVSGFLLFLVLYWGTARAIRRSANTFVSVPAIAGRFVPTLLPIAAAYHFAHFFGYFLEFLPALGTALVHPMEPVATVPTIVLPDWFGGVQLTVIVVGHIVAVWAAHGTAFDVFTGRVQPLRSQYPLAALMIAYTMTSLWIVSQPVRQPPFV